MPTIWALGFQEKEGMEALLIENNGKITEISIGSEKIGNMKQPSRMSIKKEIFDKIKMGDVVLLPGGNTYELGGFLILRTSEVYWISPTALEVKRNESVPEALLRLWKTQQNLFNQFQLPDKIATTIIERYKTFTQREKEKIALGNSLSQDLRRLRDELILGDVEEEEFVKRYVEEQISRASKIFRSFFGKTPERPALKKIFEQEARELYRAYTAVRIDKKKIVEAEGKIKSRRLKALEAELEVIMATLKNIIENSYLKPILEIKGLGPRVVSALITHIRNPKFYPNANHLLGYLNLLPREGRRRTRSDIREEGKGVKLPGEKDIWQWSHQAGFYSNPSFLKIYQAYKVWAWITYYELYKLCQEIFKYWDKKNVDPDIVRKWAKRMFMKANDWPLLKANKRAKEILKLQQGTGSSKHLVSILFKLPREQREALEKELGFSIFTLKHLRHSEIKKLAREIESRIKDASVKEELRNVYGNGNWEAFKRVVSRGGHNIQITPKRIEDMARRMLGKQVVKLVYYTWLAEALQEDIQPIIEEDKEYIAQCNLVGISTTSPAKFDISIVAEAIRIEAKKAFEKAGYSSIEELPEEIKKSCGSYLEQVLT